MFKRLLFSMAVVFALVGCKDNNEKEAAVNLVTVTTDGNGSAESDVKAAAEGQQVTLRAVAGAGYEFAAWVVASGNLVLEDATANPLTFRMPGAAVTIKATFRAEAEVLYALSVKAGTGGSVNWGSSKGEGSSVVSRPKEVAAGDVVALSAEAVAGYRFVRWNVLAGKVDFISGDATSSSANFRMPSEEVSLEAEFEEALYEFSIDGAIEGGAVSSTVSAGQVQEGKLITLTASPSEGYLFRLWDIAGLSGLDTDNLKNPRFSFKMPGNDVRVSAVFSLPVEDVIEKISDPVFKAYAQYCLSHEQEITVDDWWYAETERTWKDAVRKTLEAVPTKVTETYPAWDTDGDGRLSETEAAAVRAIDVSRAALDAIGISGTIKSLSSDYYFSGVELLHASNQEIETLNANEFPALKTLICDHSGLKSITLEKCSSLEKLFVEHNQLTALEIGRNKMLNSLSCWDNHIGRIDISSIKPKDGKFFLRMGAQRKDDNDVLNETPPAVRPEGLTDAEYEAYKNTDEYKQLVNSLHKSVEASMILNVHNSHWGTITENWCDELQYNRMVGWVSW